MTKIIGLAGSVAAGKSTLAAQLSKENPGTEVVSTDGFLLPNAELERRGLLGRKGFPESYDAEALSRFLDALRAGEPARIPLYSHQTYDIVPGQFRELLPPERVIVEGINALQPRFTAGKLDLRLYLHAEETALFRWYRERLLRLRDDARTDPSSYFTRFLELTDDAWEGRIRQVWETVNLPNLHEHILPTRALADWVVEKEPDHSLSSPLKSLSAILDAPRRAGSAHGR